MSAGSWRKPERIRSSGAQRGRGASGSEGRRDRRGATGGDRGRPSSAQRDAAGGNGGATGAKPGGSPPKVYDDLKGVLVGLSTKEERDFLFKIEGELTKFIDSDARRFVFPPMNGHFRRLLHITCRRFGVDSSSSSQSLWGLDKGMEVLRQTRSRTPVLQYADLIPAICDPEHSVYSFPTDAPPVSILPEAAEAAAGFASASRQQRLVAQRADAGGDNSKSGRRRGRGAFQFGASPGNGTRIPAEQSVDEVQTALTIVNTADGGDAPVGMLGESIGAKEAGFSATEQARSAARGASAGVPCTKNDAHASYSVDAEQLQEDEHEEQEQKNVASIQQSDVVPAELRANGNLSDSDKQGSRPDIGDQPSVQQLSASDDPHSNHDFGSMLQIDEEKELQPSQPSQYGRYTAEVRQANAQQWQAKSGADRRTHASLQPNSADDATTMVASHSTWRLRRPGNGYVSFKAKGTAGMSVVFSMFKMQEKRHGEQHLRDGECYYEVRLGQRSDGAAAAQMIDQHADAGSVSGFIAKHTAGNGMEILPQHATGSVRLRTCVVQSICTEPNVT